MNFEDIAADIRLVRLETNEHILLRRFSGYVGDKYIIARDQEKLLLFSADGKFICTISRRGKGPGEFHYIDAIDVDENEHFLYFHDQRKDYISKYDLRTTSFEKNIPLARETNLMSGLLSLNDTTLAILSGIFANNGYLYFFQTTDGRILEGVEKEPYEGSGAWAGASAVFRKTSEKKLMFQPHDSDTIFYISGSTIMPAVIFNHPKPFKKGDFTRGTKSNILETDENMLFLYKSGYEKTITQKSASYRELKGEFILHNMNKNKTYTIEKVCHHLQGTDIDIPYLNINSGDRTGIAWNAIDLKELLAKKLESNDFQEKDKENLEKLYQQISPGDNPILLTGRWRR